MKLNRLEEATTDGLTEWQRLQTNGLTDTYVAAMLLSSVGEALRGRGQIDQLHRIVEPLTSDQMVGPASWKMHEQRC